MFIIQKIFKILVIKIFLLVARVKILYDLTYIIQVVFNFRFCFLTATKKVKFIKTWRSGMHGNTFSMCGKLYSLMALGILQILQPLFCHQKHKLHISEPQVLKSCYSRSTSTISNNSWFFWNILNGNIVGFLMRFF